MERAFSSSTVPYRMVRLFRYVQLHDWLLRDIDKFSARPA